MRVIKIKNNNHNWLVVAVVVVTVLLGIIYPNVMGIIVQG